MQSHRKRAVIQHAVKQSTNISSMSTLKINENMTIKMNNNKDNILKKMIKIILQTKESTLR